MVALVRLVALALAAAVAFGEKRLLYIGGKNMLEYDAPSGIFSVYEFELDAIGSCNPFPSMPLMTGSISDADKMVFLGGRQLLHVDDKSSTFEIMGCQAQKPDSPLAPASLDCNTAINGSLDLFEGGLKNEVAAAKDKVMEFNPETGDFYIYQLNMQPGDYETLPQDCSITDSCGVQAPVVATGSLAGFCPSGTAEHPFVVSGYNQDQFVVHCKGSSTYVIVGMVPVAFQEYNLDVVLQGTFGEAYQLLNIPGNKFMRYNAQQMAWEAYACESGHCHKESSGTFFDEPECSYTSINKCVNDTRCGYCVDSSKCVTATSAGICYGQCQKFVTKFVSSEPDEGLGQDDRPQVVYIGDKMVMHFLAAKGSYSIFQIVDNPPLFDGKCPYLGQTPVYKGVLPFKQHLVSYYGEREIMFRNPKTGYYALWKCESMIRSNTTSAPCEVSTEGRSNFALSPNTVVTFGNYTMGVNEHNGSVLVYKVRDPTGMTPDQSFFDDAPAFTQVVDALKHRKIAMMGKNYLLDWNNFGEYRVWTWDSNRGIIMGPTSTGQFANMVYEVNWLGEDRLLLSKPENGDYISLRYEKDMLAHASPLGFSAIGRGNFQTGVCNFNDCETCAKDARCGWCVSTHTCMPGNELRPCSDGTGFQGCLIWTKGYCADDSCTHQQSREDCLKYDSCGWCAKARTCLSQTNGVADNMNCMGNLYWKGMPGPKMRAQAHAKTDL